MEKKKHWPGYAYGPGGQEQVFTSAEEIPEGWYDHPSKVGSNAPMEWPGPDDPEDAPKDEPVIRDGEEVARQEREAARIKVFEDQQRADRQKILDAEALPKADGEADKNGSGVDDDDEEEALDEDDGEDGEEADEFPAIDDITKDEIKARLTASKVEHNASWDKTKLYKLLEDHVKGE